MGHRVRVLCTAIVLLAVSVGPVAAAHSGPPDAPGLSTPLRVATYNIAAGHGNLARVADALRDLDADVVGLQEVDVHWGARSGFADQAAELAEALDMEVFFAPIYTFDGAGPEDPPRRFGLAVLSRFPILSATNHDIHRLSTQDATPVPRPMPGFPEVVVNVRGIHVRVLDTHLDFRTDPTVRELQVDDMLEILGEDPTHTILLGDLNAEPADPELQPLFAVLRDAWAVAGTGDGRTYPATTPRKRIDYVLTSPDIAIDSIAVPLTDASDHRSVVADLTLARETRP